VATLGPRVGSVHIHDNKGFRDEHLWPGEGNIDWATTLAALKALPEEPAGVLEIHYGLNEGHAGLEAKIRDGLARLA
jgi:sugar phosphate isomerase/epimerase